MTYIKILIRGNLLLIVCLLLSASGFAQHPGDSRISITLPNAEGAFNTVLKKFYERGYLIDQKDEINGFIASKPKSDPLTLIIIKANIDSNVITFSGQVAPIKSLYPSFKEIYCPGKKGSFDEQTVGKDGWMNLDLFVKLSFMDAKIIYSR